MNKALFVNSSNHRTNSFDSDEQLINKIFTNNPRKKLIMPKRASQMVDKSFRKYNRSGPGGWQATDPLRTY